MIIPIRVLVNLRITLVQKLSIGVVFIVGIITMVFAIVRVISLNSSVNGGQVSTQWLMLWAGIEGAVGMSLPQHINHLKPTIVNTDHSANLFFFLSQQSLSAASRHSPSSSAAESRSLTYSTTPTLRIPRAKPATP